MSADAAAAAASTTKPWDGPASGPMVEGRPHEVRFGKVEGENRGPNPIDPPLVREDKWFWLRDDDRKDEDVLGHLRRERDFLDHKTAPLKGAMDTLYEEHVARLKETDVSCPVRDGPWEYYRRTIKGLSYAVRCRRPRGTSRLVDTVPEERGTVEGEQEYLDVNKLAEGHSQCDVNSVDVSPSHKLVAFTVDYTGNEVYALHVRDAAAGGASEPIDSIEGVPMDGSFEFGLDDATIYYTTRDEQLRSFRVFRHVIGQPVSKDELIMEESDEVWSIGCGKTLEGNHLVIGAGSTESSEEYVLDLHRVAANDKLPEAERKTLKELLACVRPREFGVRYSVEGIKGDMVVLTTNQDGAINNKVVKTTVSALGDWSNVIVPHDPEVKIDSVTLFKSWVALGGRADGLTQVWTVLPNASGDYDATCERRRLTPPEPIYDIGLGGHAEFDSATLRVIYSSLTTPTQVWEVDVKADGSHAHSVVKTETVYGYDASKYVGERRQATAPDGTKIDISIVRRADLDMSKPQPTLLYGYGSYGICIDPDFNARALAYVERGVVYCIAHIRGGGENGRAWYEKQGKYLVKRNTFTDFIACAEELVSSGVTTPALMATEGRSAGGLLMGAVVNMRPDLFKVCVAGVPFVDVMTTMCDPSIPLTTGEWEEWGNPNEWKYHDYMNSYSPMDNVRRQPYPNMLIIAGLHDPRVAYWEPTKWALKLREHSTAAEHDILVKMDMEVGHFSASDRYKHLREKAFEQAYVLSKIAPDTLPK